MRPPRSPFSPLRSPSHAWPTPSAFSSMTLPPSSPTFLLPTHSRPPTSPKAGIPASLPQPARPSPASRATAAAFMSHPRMAPRFPFSGGVRSHAFFHLLPISICVSCRKWHPIVRHRHRVHHLRPSARRQHKLVHLAYHFGYYLVGRV